MTIYPVQRWGIGDIIFTITLAKSFSLPITWVTLPYFVDGLQSAYPDINFTTEIPIFYDDSRMFDYTVEDKRFLPFRWCDSILKVPYSSCMRAKYDFYNLDYRTWKDKAMWQRNEAKEMQLFTALGLKLGDKYNLINNTFRSDNSGRIQVSCNNGYKSIEMQPYEGFSLFDWAAVMESATEIHTVSTSILFILEMLDLHMPIHLYSRNPDETDFRNIDYLFTKPYILHQ